MPTALDIERRILQWLSNKVGPDFAQTIDPQQPFFNYGLDFLAMVTLEAELSELVGRAVSTEAIFDYETPRDLANYLADQP